MTLRLTILISILLCGCVGAQTVMMSGVKASGIGAGSAPVNSVTSYGALGDGINMLVSTTSNSSTIGTPIALDASRVGEVIQLTGVAPILAGFTNADICCLITGITGTNVTIQYACGYTKTGVYCHISHNDAPAFQAAAIAAGTNTTIIVPSGSYLVANSLLLSTNATDPFISAVYPGFILTNGGSHWVGIGNPTVTTVGAGQLHPETDSGFTNTWYPVRGVVCEIFGPGVNVQYPITFDGITFDGGVTNGEQSYSTWPFQADGSGWDLRHHSHIYFGGAVQFVCQTVYRNCTFQHWRGEMNISTTGNGGTNTSMAFTNCTFYDGNASGLNPTFSVSVSTCLFSNLVLGCEYDTSYPTSPWFFDTVTMTNIRQNDLSIVGPHTNQAIQAGIVKNSSLHCSSAAFNIQFAPAQNVTVSNTFFWGTSAFGVGIPSSGYQPPSGYSGVSNIVVTNCAFHTFNAWQMANNTVNGVSLFNNTYDQGNQFAGSFAAITTTNIVLAGNTAPNGSIDFSSCTGYPLLSTNNSLAPKNFPNTDASEKFIHYTFGPFIQVQPSVSGCPFALNDSDSNSIPNGAIMFITNIGTFACTMFLSGSRGTPSTNLNVNQVMQVVFTNHYNWVQF